MAKSKPPVPKANHPGNHTEINWDSVRTYYIVQNLNPASEEPTTLPMVAKHFGIGYGTVRNRSSKEDWPAALAAERKKLSEGAIEKARITIEWNEAEIRTRQWKIARLALAKATQKLQNINPDLLTHREMIDLLNLGMTEERKAAGIADKHVFQHQMLTEEQAREEAAIKHAVGVMARLAGTLGGEIPPELQALAQQVQNEQPALEHDPHAEPAAPGNPTLAGPGPSF